MKKSIITALIIVVICGCVNGNKIDKVNEVAFDSVVVDTTCALANNPNSPKCEVALSIQYAKGNNADVINESLLRSGILSPDYFTLANNKTDIKLAVDSFVHKYISDYKKDYGELYRQDKEHGSSYNCSYKVSTNIKDGADNVIVYLAEIYSYAGGAHGISQTIVKNFNTSTGRIIHLNDIFVPGYEQTLKDIIIKKLAEKFKAEDLDGLKKQCIFTDNNIYIPDNFIFDEDEITFIYCEDEIAPHAVGEIRIKVDTDDMSNILKKQHYGRNN